MVRVRFFGYFTAPYHLYPISLFVPFFLVQTPPPASAAITVGILCQAPVVLGVLTPWHVIYSHLIRTPFRSPVFALLVPVVFLFGHIGGGVLPSKFIAMFASHVGVAITIALAVAASSIAVVAPLASTSSRTLRYCGFVDFWLLKTCATTRC